MDKAISVTYDRSLQLFSVSPTIWMAVGPTQWFDNYNIVSLMSSPLERRLGLIDLRDYMLSDDVLPRTVVGMCKSPGFRRMITDRSMAEYTGILSRSSAEAYHFPSLTNDYGLASRYENKVWLRQRFSDRVRFPEFTIVAVAYLDFERLNEQFPQGFVIQDAQLGGGKGTFVIKNKTHFVQALSHLQQKRTSSDDSVVVSRLLADASERTLQVCISKDGIRVGPPQAQLVRHPLLTSLRAGDMQFCGGRIGPGLLSSELYNQATSAARLLGESLSREGYRGIFGIDFLISGGELYVLEVNPRLTGLTPLLSFLQKDVPFLLLHILELANSDYEVQGDNVDSESGSFLELYAQVDGVTDFESGVYNDALEKIGEGFEEGSILPEDERNFFVGMRVNANERFRQGKSLAFIYSKQQLFNNEGDLSHAAEQFVMRLRQKIAGFEHGKTG